MHAFKQEFTTLQYIVSQAKRVLLVAHTRPDPDAVGSVLSLKYYLEQKNIHVDIACYSPFPEFLINMLDGHFSHPDDLDLSSYDVIIGCDSVDRGFGNIVGQVSDDCVSVAIDHHHDIDLSVDVFIVDPKYAATCEILYAYFIFDDVIISKEIATTLLLGILGDTGGFQHSNTSAHVMKAAADLMQHGADTSCIMERVFANKKIETLKLWGTALEKARLDSKTGMIVTALTSEDLNGQEPTSEDIKEVASILSTVPNTKYSLIIFQISPERIKASLRAQKDAGVDVSEIAHQFGGGGHPLASGFEMDGKIIDHDGEWEIV